MVTTRASTRQAAVKANQALSQGAAGSKRRGASTKGRASKREKKDEETKEKGEDKQPTVTEGSLEQKAPEVWSEEQPVEEPQDQRPKTAEETLERRPEEQPEEKPEDRREKRPEERPEEKAEERPAEKPAEEPQDQRPKTPEETLERKPEEKPEEKRPEKEVPNGTEEKPAPSEQETAQKESAAPNGAGTAVRDSPKREEIVPSNLLEKGIIYFFLRPRVNVQEPHSFGDVARSLFVMRPTPRGAKLEDGPIGSDDNCRLLILPKKRFPTSGSEREMGFVAKAKVSMQTLRETFIAEERYETQTRGGRTTPEAKPYAEGVYAITRTTRASHLAYILTIPSEVSDIQQDFGLYNRGSFIIQSKNPKYPGPSYARLPKDPEYPKDVMEKFADLRWVPAEPELLDYPNAQFLMIGEAQDNLGKGGISEAGGKEPNQEQPGEVLEKFEDENLGRIESLKGDHSVYEDLGMDAKKYPKVPTTWD
ncbi:hypothetical protein VTN96DRAFT_442 [Rasamsonia emersonii]